MAEQTKTNGFAVTALVLGIVALVTRCLGIVLGAMAVIFGFVALKQIDDSHGQQGGRGMAISGLVCGIVAVVIYGGWYILALIGSGSAPLIGGS